MRFVVFTLLFVSCMGRENLMSDQHPVIATLEQMQHRDYQFEIDGAYKFDATIDGELTTMSFNTHMIVSKSGLFASYYEPENNPESLFRFSDGKFIYTINIDEKFINSPCLEGIEALHLYPHLLLEQDYFQREVVSNIEMKFYRESGAKHVLSADANGLIGWGNYKIKGFELGRSDQFRDLRSQGFELSAADDCGGYFQNQKSYYAVIKSINEF